MIQSIQVYNTDLPIYIYIHVYHVYDKIQFIIKIVEQILTKDIPGLSGKYTAM